MGEVVASPTYDLRPATDEDFDFLCQLHQLTMRSLVEATWGWNETYLEHQFRSDWNPSQRHIVVVGGRDVGTVTVEEGSAEVFLDFIAIHPDYQGRELGTVIIRDILNAAHQRGLTVGLHVLKANQRAFRLYERLGFYIVEERAERYVMQSPVTTLGLP